MELISRIRIDSADRVGARGEIENWIGKRRYAVTIGALLNFLPYGDATGKTTTGRLRIG